MRKSLAILMLGVLCAVGLRAQPPAYPVVGVWSATNQNWFTNTLITNGQGMVYPLSGVAGSNVTVAQQLLGGGLPTNWIAVGSPIGFAPVTNLNLLGQQSVSFFLEFQVKTNQGSPGSVGGVSNLLVQFDVSPDYAIWNWMGQASNALWISDTNYVLSIPVQSNNAAVASGWTNWGWTNFSTKGIQAIRPGSNIFNTSTNLIVSNLWLEYLYK
jgi:hypothetical protein